MKLKKLLNDIPSHILKSIEIKGSKEIQISGLCSNSKVVAPGNLFIAKKGFKNDGALSIPEAVQAGAVAVLSDIFDPFLKVTQIIHSNVKELEALLAANYYQFPSDELYMVGVTGTNGKTTTTYCVKHLLDHISLPSGLIGTIEYMIGIHRYRSQFTTPDILTNQKLLRDMVNNGCKAAVMEVSSHGLDQDRVHNIDYDIAIFSNLTQDHLDYHPDMEHYAQSKAKLFTSLNPKKVKNNHPEQKTAIINVDSSWSGAMIAKCTANILTYGLQKEADLRAEAIQLTAKGTSFTINYKGKKIEGWSPLVGRFNVYNYLAAFGVGIVKGLALDTIVNILKTIPAIPGRLERVENKLGIDIFVDYAHTDDALLNVLASLIEFKRKKIYVVFGCGGDRDPYKRPKMAQAVEKYADHIIVTSDNPRSEDPKEILQQIVKGFTHTHNVDVIVDRKEAIQKAIDMMELEDILLIAGKGHENYQIFAHQTIAFDDKEVARIICEERNR